MKNVLKAKPLAPSYIRKIDKYFKNKSQLFDTFDEIFLHIGFIIDDTNHKPSELVELAIEDIIFTNQDDMQKHISEYFYFHNSIVKFLTLLEIAKDADEVVRKCKKVAKVLFELCDSNVDIFQNRLSEEAMEIVDIIIEDYDISVESGNGDLAQALREKLNDDLAANTMANIIEAIPSLQAREYSKKQSISIASTLLLLCMVFNYLRKEKVTKNNIL